MKKPDAEEVAMRLLCESAEDSLDRLEAGKVVIERYSRLSDKVVKQMLQDQHERQR